MRYNQDVAPPPEADGTIDTAIAVESGWAVGARESEPMDSFARGLSLLHLLTVDRPTVTVVDVTDALDCSRTTAYRYLKSLTEAGLLASLPEGKFSLGARVIELDRQIRLSDPLLLAAETRMRELSLDLDVNAFVCSYYKEAVICITQSWIHEAWYTSWGRGQPMSLLRGAAGKAILAHLPTSRLANLMLARPEEIAAAGLGSSWEEFRTRLKKIRKDGYCLTVAEVDPETAGLAAPVFDSDGRVIGSLVLSITLSRLQSSELAAFTAPLLSAAQAITSSLQTTEK